MILQNVIACRRFIVYASCLRFIIPVYDGYAALELVARISLPDNLLVGMIGGIALTVGVDGITTMIPPSFHRPDRLDVYSPDPPDSLTVVLSDDTNQLRVATGVVRPTCDLDDEDITCLNKKLRLADPTA